jgi:uncharacterized protein YwgA
MHVQIEPNDPSVYQVLEVVRAAGGSIVGRTRLQKTIYLLGRAGFVYGFEFEYRHYGPYSEDLSNATLLARMSGSLNEEERRANWGGAYSVFNVSGSAHHIDAAMQEIINISTSSNPVALELAATAAFLADEGYPHPWEETEARKPEKAKYLDLAKEVYSKLLRIRTPNPLPEFS